MLCNLIMALYATNFQIKFRNNYFVSLKYFDEWLILSCKKVILLLLGALKLIQIPVNKIYTLVCFSVFELIFQFNKTIGK